MYFLKTKLVFANLVKYLFIPMHRYYYSAVFQCNLLHELQLVTLLYLFGTIFSYIVLMLK